MAASLILKTIDGTNLFVETMTGFPSFKTHQVCTEFTEFLYKENQVHPSGELLVLEKKYRLFYRLIESVYILVLTQTFENSFAVWSICEKVESLLRRLNKNNSFSTQLLLKSYPIVSVSLQQILNGDDPESTIQRKTGSQILKMQQTKGKIGSSSGFVHNRDWKSSKSITTQQSKIEKFFRSNSFNSQINQQIPKNHFDPKFEFEIMKEKYLKKDRENSIELKKQPIDHSDLLLNGPYSNYFLNKKIIKKKKPKKMKKKENKTKKLQKTKNRIEKEKKTEKSKSKPKEKESTKAKEKGKIKDNKKGKGVKKSKKDKTDKKKTTEKKQENSNNNNNTFNPELISFPSINKSSTLKPKLMIGSKTRSKSKSVTSISENKVISNTNKTPKFQLNGLFDQNNTGNKTESNGTITPKSGKIFDPFGAQSSGNTTPTKGFSTSSSRENLKNNQQTLKINPNPNSLIDLSVLVNSNTTNTNPNTNTNSNINNFNTNTNNSNNNIINHQKNNDNKRNIKNNQQNNTLNVNSLQTSTTTTFDPFGNQSNLKKKEVIKKQKLFPMKHTTSLPELNRNSYNNKQQTKKSTIKRVKSPRVNGMPIRTLGSDPFFVNNYNYKPQIQNTRRFDGLQNMQSTTTTSSSSTKVNNNSNQSVFETPFHSPFHSPNNLSPSNSFENLTVFSNSNNNQPNETIKQTNLEIHIKEKLFCQCSSTKLIKTRILGEVIITEPEESVNKRDQRMKLQKLNLIVKNRERVEKFLCNPRFLNETFKSVYTCNNMNTILKAQQPVFQYLVKRDLLFHAIKLHPEVKTQQNVSIITLKYNLNPKVLKNMKNFKLLLSCKVNVIQVATTPPASINESKQKVMWDVKVNENNPSGVLKAKFLTNQQIQFEPISLKFQVENFSLANLQFEIDQQSQQFFNFSKRKHLLISQEYIVNFNQN
ncbi:hypothetical protein M0812_09591 [Anaeramoeba flamelloides]|uniref:MHD domain-containing protein n=1 Tax=Anaeramoeba flamelloides TaxID=1746091 RepID=A0AAV7ZTD0_9EUKA|nr:hypothetical protein M0812_09591 [Anaeramoeba flamelloides]